MKKYPIISSTIKFAGYDLNTRTLTLEFASGGVYEYAEVPPEQVTEFMFTDSIGGYFNKAIKPNYKCTKIEKPEEVSA